MVIDVCKLYSNLFVNIKYNKHTFYWVPCTIIIINKCQIYFKIYKSIIKFSITKKWIRNLHNIL